MFKLFVFVVFAVTVFITPSFATLLSGKVSLKADNGFYLARCNNCGPAVYPDSVGVHETNPYNPWSMWALQVIGNKVAFLSDNGYYLTRCNNCWVTASYKDGVFAHVGQLENNPWSLWTPERLLNGKWAFKADNGMYLSRCNSCVAKGAFSDFAFAHVSNLAGNPWSMWTVQYRFPLGPVSLLSDIGTYLLRCNNCGNSPYKVSAGVGEANVDNKWVVWNVEAVGQKIALKGDNDMYLTRCNDCWSNGLYADSAFVHVSSLQENPWSLWTPEFLSDGKWALKADNGMYLTRCRGCVSDGQLPDFAFVHVSTPVNNPWSHWTPTYAFPFGRVTLQADNGNYLARCNNCGPAAYPDSVGVHVTRNDEQWTIWTAEIFGNKVVFKSDNGNYLTRCKGCWSSASFMDGVFTHVSTPVGNPWSTWTPEILEDGKWALKGDNGMYLARCRGCVSGGSFNDFAFVHVGTVKDNPWAAWTIQYSSH